MGKKHVCLVLTIIISLIFIFAACENPLTGDQNNNSGSGSSSSSGSLVAVADSFSVIEGRSTTIPIANMTANDEDNSDNPPLVIIWVGNAVGGEAQIEGANIDFNCNVSSGHTASFEYHVANSIGLESTGMVTLEVQPVPPIVAAADTYDLIQGETLLLVASSLLDNDEDGEGRPLSVISAGNPAGGTVTLNGENISFVSTGYAYEPAGFEYTVQNDLGTTATGSVYVNVTPLSPIEAFIYHNEGLMNAKLAEYQPPSMTDIFNSWGRFDGNNYYENKDDLYISSNASAWQFLTNPDRVSMPLNVYPYNGFVSPDKLENFTFEATLASTNSDDDTIGVVIAFVRIAEINYTLNAVRNQGGNSPSEGWGICYGESSSYNTWIIDSKSVGGIRLGWSGQQSRVKVERNGDNIKCYATIWNDADTYQAASEITIDLDSDSRLHKFKGPQSYGYMTYSQPDSTYLSIGLGGSLDVTRIYNAVTGDVWEYVEGSGWTVIETTVQNELGFVRQVINPDTGDIYLIKENEIILQ